MTSGEWQDAWRIYEAARELPSGQQRAFVETQSADPDISREVMDLLASLDREESQPSDPFYVKRAGTQVGRYRVAEMLGRGGMGEVYAAHDMDLGRTVALKFLRPQAIGDPPAVKRFLREAKSASALNHPNILTIYEVIDSSAGQAIAMELVEGRPLQELHGSKLPSAQVAAIGKQAASALAAAHDRGIVHRDIKPENLMMRPDGLLKVLDFGVARQFGPKDSSARLTTATGSPVGTLRYMSPEQLRGEVLTGATDVFSLGLVLYELLAGRHPFESAYAWETAHSLHTRDPEPPSAVNSETPAWLDDLIVAMLNREAGLRPAAREVAAALSLERTVVAPARVPAPREQPAAAPERARARYKKWALWATAATGVVAAAWFARDLLPSASLKAGVFTDYPGDEDTPSFSPDGQKVAFVWTRPNQTNRDIFVRAIGSQAMEQITNTPLTHSSPAWSPAGASIAFISRPAYSRDAGIFVVPAAGGAERKIADVTLPRANASALLAWTPDGKWLVGPSRETASDPVGLFRISPTDGSKLRLTRPAPDQLDLYPAIALDGRMLAFTRSSSDGVFSIYLLPLAADFAAAGEPQPLPSFPNLRVGTPQWTADGRELLFVANPKGGTGIWRMRVPASGEAPQPPRREAFAGPAFDIKIGPISATAHRLIYSTEVQETNLWRVPLQTSGAAPQPRKIGAASEQNAGARISPDGSRIAFESQRTGSAEIWTANIDGSDARALTNFGGPGTGSPAWSPDGRQIAFDSRAEGRPHIYVVSVAGGAPRRITETLAENYLPSWSRDGRWIYFCSSQSGTVEVWRQPAGGGAAEQVTHGGARAPVESLDGAALYYERQVPAVPAANWSLRRLTLATGDDVQVLPAIIDRNFDVARDGIYYVPEPESNGRRTIQFLDTRTGVSRLVTPVQRVMSRCLSVAPDGSFLLYSQLDRWGHDLMLVDNFR